jgi:hypothetical protein
MARTKSQPNTLAPDTTPVEDTQTAVRTPEDAPPAMAVPTVNQVVETYVKLAGNLTKIDANAKYNWAAKLSGLLDSLADDRARTATSTEIGKSIAEGLGREKAYSGSWVRQHAAAYAKFPEGLHSPEEFKAFLDAVNGNTARTAKADAPDTDTEEPNGDGANANTPDPLARLDRLVKRLLSDGFAPQDIIARVKSACKS